MHIKNQLAVRLDSSPSTKPRVNRRVCPCDSCLNLNRYSLTATSDGNTRSKSCSDKCPKLKEWAKQVAKNSFQTGSRE